MINPNGFVVSAEIGKALYRYRGSSGHAQTSTGLALSADSLALLVRSSNYRLENPFRSVDARTGMEATVTVWNEFVHERDDDNDITPRTMSPTPMRRYEPECEGETLFLVAADDRVEVGAIDDVVAAVGSDTYTIEYDEKQRTQPWLDTDDGTLEIDVRESVTTITHTGEFVSELCEHDMATERYGLPRRTVEFANRFVDVLEQQGKE